MYYNYNGMNLYYEIKGSGYPIVFLHGWGKDSNEFKDIKIDDHKIILVDFLGFGKSSELVYPFKLLDYIKSLHELLQYINVEHPILVGHSFGGRVAILYSYYYPTTKIVLVNSAGIRPKRNLKYYVSIYRYKILKKLFYYTSKEKYDIIRNKGNEEYIVLNDTMRETFSNIVNLDLKKYLKEITTPTLILSSLNDKIIPLKDGQLMNKLLVNSKLIVFYKSNHFIYLDEKKKFLKVLNNFIKEE